MKQSPKEISKNYSKPIFEQAKSAGQIAEWGDVLKQLSVIVQQPEVDKFITDRRFSINEVVDFMRETVLGASVAPEVKGFIADLAQAHSLHLLPLIHSFYDERARNESGNNIVYIKTAFPMTEDEAASMTDFLKKKFNVVADKTVVEVDSSLIGGAVISFADKILDGSIKGKLASLKESLNS